MISCGRSGYMTCHPGHIRTQSSSRSRLAGAIDLALDKLTKQSAQTFFLVAAGPTDHSRPSIFVFSHPDAGHNRPISANGLAIGAVGLFFFLGRASRLA